MLAGTAAAQQEDGETHIALSDDGITVNGQMIALDGDQAVYAANDIVFYLEGQDFTYGEGTEKDSQENKHSKV